MFVLLHLLPPELDIYFSCLVMAEFWGERRFPPDNLRSINVVTKVSFLLHFFLNFDKSDMEHLLLLHQNLEILLNFCYPNVTLPYITETEGMNDSVVFIKSHFFGRSELSML